MTTTITSTATTTTTPTNSVLEGTSRKHSQVVDLAEEIATKGKHNSP